MKFAKMGVQDLIFGFVQHVAHAMVIRGGWGGCDNVLDEYVTSGHGVIGVIMSP